MGPDLRAGVSRLSPSFMASLTARASGWKQRLTIADRGTFKAAANECGNANDKRAGTVDGGLAIEPRNRQHRVLHEVGGDEGSPGYRASHRWFLLPEVRNSSSDSPRGRKSPKPKLLECPRRMGPATGSAKRKRTF